MPVFRIASRLLLGLLKQWLPEQARQRRELGLLR